MDDLVAELTAVVGEAGMVPADDVDRKGIMNPGEVNPDRPEPTF